MARVKFFKMRRYYILFAFLACFLGSSFASSIIVDGNYQLRNIFVLNTEDASGVGYCVKEVRVNGSVTSDEINSSAFEIDLSQYGLSLGDKVEVVISYSDGCAPKVLNPDALKAKPTFDIKEIKVDDEGVLNWITMNEQGSIPYIVQQFKWNKWVTLGVVEGAGTSSQNEYRFKVIPVSGKNKVRVVQKSINGELRTSKVVSFDSDTDPVTFKYDSRGEKVVLSGSTSFELYDGYGQVIKRGYDSVIDVSTLEKGDYHITFDSTTGSFDKR